MKLQIDIKTPAGQSLEGFPLERESSFWSDNPILSAIMVYIDDRLDRSIPCPVLHPGDTITITVL